ncbi:MAG: hypothetical protein ACYTXY_50505, partial [Nostoc sp.]
AVPLPYGTLRERGSKLRAASRREVRAAPTLFSSLGYSCWNAMTIKSVVDHNSLDRRKFLEPNTVFRNCHCRSGSKCQNR